MTTVCSFTSNDGNQHDYEICLEAHETEYSTSKVEVRLKITGYTEPNSENIDIPIEVDLTTEQVSIPKLNFSVEGYASCIALCGAGNIVQEIIKCIKQCKTKNNNTSTPQCLISCLRAKGYEIAGSLAKCAAKCVGKA